MKKLVKEVNINDVPKGYVEVPNDLKYVSLRNINKIYDNNVQAVFDFNLDINPGEFITFVGPSGCGKTTTLRMIAGLEEITSGELWIDKVFANDLSPINRDISMVFQNYALFPHMTVFDNMAFGIKLRKIERQYPATYRKNIKDPSTNEILHHKGENMLDENGNQIFVKKLEHYTKQEIKERVLEAAKTLELENYLNRKPKALSGGQRQRVALGRSIVRNAKVFLMDEPLSNLDAKLRVQMRSEIIKLHRQLKNTTIYVTHDQTEAMTMADRIVVMKDGYIQQVGTPIEIYNNPSNVFVASFIGAPAMNFINARFRKDKVEFYNAKTNEVFSTLDVDKDFKDKLARFKTENLALLKSEYEKLNNINTEKMKKGEAEKFESKKICTKNKIDGLTSETTSLLFGIRPEDIHLLTEENREKYMSKNNCFKLKITVTELLGHEYFVHADFAGQDIICKAPVNTIYGNNNEFIEVIFDLNKIHIFDSNTTKRII